jgi:hypothetical protein
MGGFIPPSGFRSGEVNSPLRIGGWRRHAVSQHVCDLPQQGSADPAVGSAALEASAGVGLLKCVPSHRPAIPLCGITSPDKIAPLREGGGASPQRPLCSSGETPEYSAALDQVQFSGFTTNPRRTGFTWMYSTVSQ